MNKLELSGNGWSSTCTEPQPVTPPPKKPSQQRLNYQSPSQLTFKHAPNTLAYMFSICLVLNQWTFLHETRLDSYPCFFCLNTKPGQTTKISLASLQSWSLGNKTNSIKKKFVVKLADPWHNFCLFQERFVSIPSNLSWVVSFFVILLLWGGGLIVGARSKESLTVNPACLEQGYIFWTPGATWKTLLHLHNATIASWSEIPHKKEFI